MSLWDHLVNVITGVAPPTWSAIRDPAAIQPDDPGEVSAAWLDRAASETKASAKGPFETTAEYHTRIAQAQTASGGSETPYWFLLPLDQEGGRSYDADSRTVSLRTRHLCITVSSQRYDRFNLGEQQWRTGGHTLQNKFGARVDGSSYEEREYEFQVVNFRSLISMVVTRGHWDHLETHFALDRDYARAELGNVRLGARVHVANVEKDKDYSYGGEEISLPNTYHKSRLTLKGSIRSLDVLNLRTKEHLGGWRVHGA